MIQLEPREQMIEQQVRAWEVLDPRVLDILRAVPRERFVPPGQEFLAFADVDVPLPHGQHMLRPNVVGRALQALEPAERDRVLEVGAGSGFFTACLAKAAAHVRSLEIFPDLAELSRANLAAQGIRNVEVVVADAMREAPQGTFDVIAVTGSLPVYDRRFEQQLNVGGRLFVVVGEPPVMEARLVRRVSGEAWSTESLFETVIDPLINAPRPEPFRF